MSARFARTISAIVLVIVLGSALTLSWSGLTTLAMSAGYGSISFLLALTIDGTVVMGSLAIVTATQMKTSPKFGWSVMMLGAIVSTVGNVLSGSAHETVIGGFTHAIPPIALALALESWLRVARRSIVVAQAIEARAEKAAVKTERAVAASLATNPPSHPVAKNKARTAPPVSPTNHENLEDARQAVAALPDEASVTSQARAVMTAMPSATGRDVAELLGLTITQGHKARGRSLAVRSIA